MARSEGAGHLLVLGGLTGLGAAATDMYTPALPVVSQNLHGSAASAQGSVSAFLFALAVGQLVLGSLSDAVGRRRLILVATAAFAASSVACAFSTSIVELSAFRALQGLGAAGGMVIGRAVVQDLARGPTAGRQYSRLVMITGLAPILAPLVGALLLLAGSWQLIFLAQAGLAVVLLTASAFRLPETLPRSARIALSPTGVLTAHRRLLANRSFAAFALVFGLAAGILFAYVAGYAFCVEDTFHASPLAYALLFGANAAGMVAVAQLNGRWLINRFPLAWLVRTGLLWSTLAAVTLTAAVVLHAPLALVAAAMWFIIASRGAIMPNTTSLAMASSSGARGSASALLGTIQWLTGAAAALLAGIGGGASATSMVIVILGFSLAALAAVGLLARGPASQEAADPPPDPDGELTAAEAG
jgi:DHA1 family bicyclomycin/chloramphenicol resistance-like MFS transporter